MRKRGSKELRPLAGRWGVQGGCTIGKTTRAGGSAEGASPLPEREVSSLPPSCPPPQAATREDATALVGSLVPLTKSKLEGTIIAWS